jgi:uncharacterized protein YcfL
MKVLTSNPPHKWKTGNLLDPEKVNDNLTYLTETAADVFSKRYAHSVVSIPFYLDSATGLTQANNQATRSIILTAPDTLVIERMYLDGALASGAATVVIYNATTGTTAPTGVTNPIFTPTTTDQTLFYGKQIQIDQGDSVRIEITGATFATSKLDLILHIRTDRFNRTDTDTLQTPSITKVTEADALDATAFNANTTAISSAVTANIAADRALKCSFVQFSNFTSSTDADRLRLEIPRTDDSTTRQQLVRISCAAAYASNGAGGSTVTWTVLNESGVTTSLASALSMSGVTESLGFDTVPEVDLSTVPPTVASDTTQDYRITVANSTATNCVKAYAFLWTE